MAATKKHEKIRAEKARLSMHIAELNQALKQCANKVPKAVLNGSHQIAVEWKQKAEKVFFKDLSTGGRTSSVNQLRELAEKKAAALNEFKGYGQ